MCALWVRECFCLWKWNDSSTRIHQTALQLLIMQQKQQCENDSRVIFHSTNHCPKKLNKLPDDYALRFDVQLRLISTASKAFRGL